MVGAVASSSLGDNSALREKLEEKEPKSNVMMTAFRRRCVGNLVAVVLSALLIEVFSLGPVLLLPSFLRMDSTDWLLLVVRSLSLFRSGKDDADVIVMDGVSSCFCGEKGNFALKLFHVRLADSSFKCQCSFFICSCVLRRWRLAMLTAFCPSMISALEMPASRSRSYRSDADNRKSLRPEAVEEVSSLFCRCISSPQSSHSSSSSGISTTVDRTAFQSMESGYP
mmetsp:Transcript_27827/g.64598  ORF Transcript_27827/g.64598 Transcript_27827/m.64598 type:complete len:225 (+) Transcript_27827:116-790(+)